MYSYMNYAKMMRFEVFAAAKIHIVVFWVMSSSSLVGGYTGHNAEVHNTNMRGSIHLIRLLLELYRNYYAQIRFNPGIFQTLMD
jgi:hypothetical protein